MALILLKRMYEGRVTAGSNNNNWLLRWHFNTTTQADEYDEININNSTRAQYGNLPPFERVGGEVIWATCGPTVADTARPNTTRTEWQYQINPRGTTLAAVIPNSSVCGFVPPAVLLCRILIPRIEVDGTTATVSVFDAVGTVEYVLLDQGGQVVRQRQASPVFENLGAGIYTVEAYDTGSTVAGCKATGQFTIEQASSGIAQVVNLPDLSFAGNAMLVQALASLAGRSILFRVYVETKLGNGEFRQVYQATRPSDAAGFVTLDVREMVRAQLRAEMHTTQGWHLLTDPIRQWYVSAAEIINGEIGPVTKSNIATVLLGGLPVEYRAEGQAFFFPEGSAIPFMSWQPEVKTVGAQHVEILQILHKRADPPVLNITHDAVGNNPPLTGQALHPALVTIGTGNGGSGGIGGDEADGPIRGGIIVLGSKWQISQYCYEVGTLATATSGVTFEVEYPRTSRIIPGRLRLEVERTAQRPTRQLVYENSLGCFDTLSTSGQLSAKLPLETQVVRRQEPVGALENTREMSWPTTTKAPVVTLSTGYLSPEWMEYLRELVQPGRQVYELVAGGFLRPLVLSNRELQLFVDDNEEPQAILEFRSAYSTPYYSSYARYSTGR